MPTYTNANEEARPLIETLIEAHHDHLTENTVTVGLLFATNDGDEPPVTNHGYPCYAVVGITSHKNRALGCPDCLIVIDGNERTGWPSWDVKMRAAILDHELEHLMVKTDKHGSTKKDSLGRPQLELAKHDYHLGGFTVIAERHKNHSIEVIQLAVLATAHGQLFFPWMSLENAGKAAKIAELAGGKAA